MTYDELIQTLIDAHRDDWLRDEGEGVWTLKRDLHVTVRERHGENLGKLDEPWAEFALARGPGGPSRPAAYHHATTSQWFKGLLQANVRRRFGTLLKAEFKDGVLYVHLPKSEKTKTKAVEVTVE